MEDVKKKDNMELLKKIGRFSLSEKPSLKTTEVKDFLINLSPNLIIFSNIKIGEGTSLSLDRGCCIYWPKYFTEEELFKHSEIFEGVKRGKVGFMNEEEVDELMEKGGIKFESIEDRLAPGSEVEINTVIKEENPFLKELPDIDKRLEEIFRRQSGRV